MKRKLSPDWAAFPTAERPTAASARAQDLSDGRRRRQPQISCDFCRHKKLKCDRSRPCSNCVARGQECHGGPAVTSALDGADASDILERLQRLEQVVFHVKRGVDSQQTSTDGTEARKSEVKSAGCPPSTDQLDDLDYHSMANKMLFETTQRYTFLLAGTLDPPTPEGHFRPEASSSQCILLPTKEDALTMFEYFLNTSHCLPRTVHVPSARFLISDFYVRAFRVPNLDQRTTHTACAAFILSICATAAFFFWDKDTVASCRLFRSVDHAARQAHEWLREAWDLLDQLRRVPNSGSLMEVQANIILSDLLYNMEGCSTRFRYLHSRALAVAREISLHLTDASPARDNEDRPLKEVTRRVWWHIASTDWLMSTMGGPLDRTYNVNPRHMIVEYPLNAEDEDMTVALPVDTTTGMTYFNLRTRLAEVCRQVADALPLGSRDINDLPYDRILAISKLFDDVMASMAPCFALDASLPPDVPPSVAVDRQVIHLAYHARFARVFRPFLLHNRRDKSLDPRLLQFRDLCLHSARSVLKISTRLLSESLGAKAARLWPLPLMYRSGCVISHLFMACVVLATDSALAPDPHGRLERHSDADAIRLELANAQRLLEQLSERSSVAANLVKKLIGVLKRHRFPAPLPAAARGESENARASEDPQTSVATDADNAQSINTTITPLTDDTSAELQEGWIQQQIFYDGRSQTVEGSATATMDGTWDYGSGVGNYAPLSVDDGLDWSGLMDTGFTDTSGWSQLFADLDATFMASI